MRSSAFTVGFDLDMTLIDSRPGVRAAMERLSEDTGVFIDAELVVRRLGPPLESELAHWFPSWEVEAAAQAYRRIYATTCRTGTTAMPGAPEAFDAVRRAGGRVVVVTAKSTPLAQVCLEAVGLHADEVRGWLWGAGKGEALGELGASVYVGDHVGDVAGAQACGAVPVAVATGPVSAQTLSSVGAEVVLADLTGFPSWLDGHLALGSRLADLDERLRGLGSVCVAFSGGADSAFVLAAAARALGPAGVLAVTAVSPSLATGELERAREFAASLGVRHEVVTTQELEREGYRANAGDRCYFCKSELLDVVGPLAGGATVVTGTNADDVLAGFRPGIRAAAERGAATPLADAGLTKAQVRTASRRLGLVTWDKPAAACLSSRIAYGVQITPERLARVDRAELALRSALHGAGIPVQNVRVRDLGEAARVEVDRELVTVLAERRELLDVIDGFDAVELDPLGFRSGAMNELLAEPERYR